MASRIVAEIFGAETEVHVDLHLSIKKINLAFTLASYFSVK